MAQCHLQHIPYAQETQRGKGWQAFPTKKYRANSLRDYLLLSEQRLIYFFFNYHKVKSELPDWFALVYTSALYIRLLMASPHLEIFLRIANQVLMESNENVINSHSLTVTVLWAIVFLLRNNHCHNHILLSAHWFTH